MIATIHDKQFLYYARRDGETSLDTAVFRLIDGIYFRFPKQARAILRNRIFYSGTPLVSDCESIKIAAKRASKSDTLPDLSKAIDVTFLNPTPTTSEHDRKITCSLKTLDGKILFSAVNTGFFTRTRHAEVNLLIQLKDIKISEPTVFHSSLKPCAMCAAHILENSGRLKIVKVTFDQDDPGKWGQNTVLTLGSASRKRYLINPDALICERTK